MLFDSDRHEILSDRPWDEVAVKSIVQEIFNRTIESFDSNLFWITDPKDEPTIPSNKSIYFGASGVLWALEQIESSLNLPLPFKPESLIQSIYQKYLEAPDTVDVLPSLFLGESGILLLHYKYAPSKHIADRLYQIIEENIPNITLEALWGAPGTMIAASYMYDWTKEDRWADLYQANARFLIDELKSALSRDEIMWTQDMYGKKCCYVGAGHGYFGNVFGLLKQQELLAPADRDFLLSNVAETLTSLALVENDLANWHALHPKLEGRLPLVQWCHGAPGIITSLELYPQNYSSEVEALLLKAGELTWSAGPLRKGVALCHGTDGNGYAFLELYKRSGNSLWLDRARKFAMHACDQRNGRFSLFTGELGLAAYLLSCLSADSRFPFLSKL